MKHIYLIIGLLVGSVYFANGQEKMYPDSMYMEVLMNQEMMKNVDMYPDLNSSIGLTANNSVLLSSPNQFYFLRWGEITPVGAYYDEPIRAFGYTPEGTLLIIQNDKLCYIKDTLGTLETLYTLPREFMNIKTGKDDIYIFDSFYNQEGKYSIYVIAKGLKYLKLLDFPEQISDVAEYNGKVLFASKNKLFSIDINTKKITSLASVENYEDIQSIAVNEKNNTIYFSSSNGIYSLNDNKMVKIFDGIKGNLTYMHNSLLVFDSGNYSLVRIVNFEKNSIIDNKIRIEREYNLRQRIRSQSN